MKKTPFGALIAAVLVVFAFAPAALAKGGGGGGGGGSCVKIDAFNLTTDLTTSYSISNSCFDEGTATAAIDYRNNTTGFVGRSFWVLSPGINSSTSTASTAPSGTSITETLTVYTPNGKIADQRTVTVITP